MSFGLTYEDIWVNLKPKQVTEYIELIIEKKRQELQVQYNLLWLQGRYTAIATHNPKEYPKKPIQVEGGKQVKKKEQTQEEIDEEIDKILNSIKKHK